MRLIDADELLKPVGSYDRVKYTYEYGDVVTVEDIELMPTIDAEPVRHGKWVIEPDATVMHCNSCGWAYEYYAGLEEEWNFCSHCGAKMDEVNDETN